MKLARKSRLVTWAYSVPMFPDFLDPPTCTSLCAFFWRTFVFTPLWWIAFVGLIGSGLYSYGVHWKFSVPATLVAAVVVYGTVRGGQWLQQRADRSLYADFDRRKQGLPPPRTWRDSLFWQGVKTIKGKVCPLIELQ